MIDRVKKTDAEWKAQLAPEQYRAVPTGLRCCVNSASLQFEPTTD